MSKSIRDILARRNDLSTFIVHLTRANNGNSAKENLASKRARTGKIEARNAYGHGIYKNRRHQAFPLDAYNTVCFTETPLEYIHLFTENIADRRLFRFEGYGIAITKAMARKDGINPIMYVDMTSGHDGGIARALDKLVTDALTAGDPAEEPIFEIVPFIEQMGTWSRSKKEFWWEREWRKIGDYQLPNTYIIICPYADHADIKLCIPRVRRERIRFIDATWGLEEIIARLAGFSEEDIHLFR